MVPSLLALCALTMTPAQPAGTLQLTNVRNTYGDLGGTRPEGKYLPGDILFVAFDIEGISLTAEGTADYSMAMEVIDKTNKPIFKQDPAQKKDFLPLGGSKIPARAYVTIGLDQVPGEYTMKLTVTDNANAAKPSQVLTRKFVVDNPGFGIVALHTTVNEQGTIQASTTGVVGQSIFVQFGIVGFDRAADPKDAKKGKQPNVAIEWQVIDEKGQPTTAKPQTFSVENGVDEKEAGFTINFPFPLTRVGKFSVRIKATDNLTKKIATIDLPITILPPAN